MSTDQPATAAGGAGPRRPDARFMLSHPAHLFSLGFGTGLSSFAPGTVGTLFGWASYLVLNLYLTVTGWAVLICAGVLGGIWLCGFTSRKLGDSDPGAVVWDEIVAFWIVLLLITPTGFGAQFVAFVIFRFFDAVKPPPIRYFDRTFKGGLGIMLDDLVAAFCTLLVIALWRSI
ncbi:phosphatidylglycerophosphatase A [Pandoraea terrae]|uniref:Phosphatidylglycerophosphatase A n=1 Tax=Pandoraea terrae TaxID=1537710 RepID=A0A5E4YU20_9BURK|nr:phosphatidylglycerophosphatase A [Pandoraea terrae]VVE51700.1 phosphatidylglycerophosphatase A [Pandoraea terrae]